MTKESGKTKTKSPGEFENCRVLDIGIGDFGECFKAGPATCSHALPFGYCFLCMHPRVSEIIENTKNQLSQGVLKS